MINLLDGIRRFKLARQAVAKPAEEQDEINVLVKMYEAIGPGNDNLKADFNKRWDKLSEEKRSEMVKRLLERGLLPEQVGHALEIFNGKVVSLV